MGTIVNVIFSPGAAFRKVKEKPDWWLPLTVVLVVLLAVSAVGILKMDYSKVREQAAEMMREQGLNEEQIQQRLETSDKFMNNPVLKFVVPLLPVAIGTVLGMVIVALILMLLVPASGGSNANFLLCLAVVAYAGVVRIVAAIVRLILVLLRGVEHAATSLVLAVPGAKGFTAHLLSRVDIFTVWEVILLALGLKVVYDLKDSRSYLYLFGLWLIYIVLASLLPGLVRMRPAR